MKDEALREARRARIYLVTPSSQSDDTERRAEAYACSYDALRALGYDVVVPGVAHMPSRCPNELLAQVDYDLMALEHCDYVVVTPGCETFFEPLLAPALGKPVIALADLVDLLLPVA
ncbi:hypothetical protein [Micromonospora sp. NPDC047730]|uniref:hypothetical protein n=1 Tax=Micromonospora sp. NPDC047730 TaxID=3364253 RepID=UPI00371B9F83